MADDPKDPENQPPEEYYEEDFEQAEEAFEQQSLGKGPAVASAPGKTMIMAFGGGAIVLFLLYQLLFSDSEPPPPPQASQNNAAQVAAPTEQPPISIQPPIIAPPPITREVEPALPPPPPPPINRTNQTLQEPRVDFSSQAPTNEQMMARRKSQIMIINTPGSGPRTNEKIHNGQPVTSSAPRVSAGRVGNLESLILQGKVIQAVLETAIDTTLPGPLRAIVARDVYAEAGSLVLIPKGSRLIGSYNSDIVRGQARIFIVWNRVIRPDGIDLQMEAPNMDSLGRAGLAGYVDERYFEIFSGALLSSVFTIGTAALGDAIAPGEISTTQNTDGSNNTSGDPVSIATAEAATNLAETAQTVLGNIIDVRPVVTVDQGTPVNVFVNQDLEFPDDILNQARFIQ